MLSPQLYRRAIPAAARIAAWTAPDGWSLRRFDWPADAAARGSILFQGGRGDIFEKYLETFAHWHGQGWAVTSLDWRGQGGSGRLSPSQFVGHVDDFASYIDDLAAFCDEWTRQAPAPHVLAGHSMGGHLILRALAEGVARPDAAVLVAPMLGLHGRLGGLAGERTAKLLGGIGNPARAAWKGNERPGTAHTRQALLTHDADRYGDEIWWQHARPELVLGPPSWRWVMQAFESTRLLRRDPRLKTLDLPMLMIVAAADRLVSPRAALQVAARLPDARVVRFGRESAHEVLREIDTVRNRAIGEIDLFLAARAPRRRST